MRVSADLHYSGHIGNGLWDALRLAEATKGSNVVS
jgi:hypothetical protein